MVGVTIQIRGTQAVEHTLRKIAPKHALTLMRATIGAVAGDLRKAAIRNMDFGGPFTTGTMKKATKLRRRKVRKGIIQTDIVVGPQAFYWRFWEYGASNKTPEKAMFGRAVRKIDGQLDQLLERHFLKKFEALLVREGKKQKARLKYGR